MRVQRSLLHVLDVLALRRCHEWDAVLNAADIRPGPEIHVVVEDRPFRQSEGEVLFPVFDLGAVRLDAALRDAVLAELLANAMFIP